MEGITQTGAAAYDFEAEAGSQRVVKAHVFPVTLDGQGAARVTVPDIPKIEQPSVLNAEMDYADANGEILTAADRVKLWPSAITLGIRREGWAASAEQMRFRVVALDLKGHPIAGQRVTSRCIRRLTIPTGNADRRVLCVRQRARGAPSRRRVQRQNRCAGIAAV